MNTQEHNDDAQLEIINVNLPHASQDCCPHCGTRAKMAKIFDATGIRYYTDRFVCGYKKDNLIGPCYYSYLANRKKINESKEN